MPEESASIGLFKMVLTYIFSSHLSSSLFDADHFANQGDRTSLRRVGELLCMILQAGANPCTPCVGGNLEGHVLFDSTVCGGILQVLL